MEKPLRTTIEIANSAKAVYEQLTARYGIKRAVSAGILLLARLAPDEREKIIDEVGRPPDSKPEPVEAKPDRQVIDSANDSIAKVRKIAKTHYKLLSKEDQEALDKFREEIRDIYEEDAEYIAAQKKAAGTTRSKKRSRRPGVA